jgi:hypothetical protein
VIDDDASIRREVADYVEASAERLWELTRMCARTAAWTLSFHSNPREALEHRDPLPESTVAALRRLRETPG